MDRSGQSSLLPMRSLASFTINAVEQDNSPALTAEEHRDISATKGTGSESDQVDTFRPGEWLDGRYYVSPFGTYMHTGGSRRAFDGWGGLADKTTTLQYRHDSGNEKRR